MTEGRQKCRSCPPGDAAAGGLPRFRQRRALNLHSGVSQGGFASIRHYFCNCSNRSSRPNESQAPWTQRHIAHCSRGCAMRSWANQSNAVDGTGWSE